MCGVLIEVDTTWFLYYRLDEGEDVEITEEKSAEQVSAEELKKRIQAEEAEDGIVCLEWRARSSIIRDSFSF